MRKSFWRGYARGFVGEVVEEFKGVGAALVVGALAIVLLLAITGCSLTQRDGAPPSTQPTTQSTFNERAAAVADATAAGAAAVGTLFPPLAPIATAVSLIAGGVGGYFRGRARGHRHASGALIEIAADIGTYKQPFEPFSAPTSKILKELGLEHVARPHTAGTT